LKNKKEKVSKKSSVEKKIVTMKCRYYELSTM